MSKLKYGYGHLDAAQLLKDDYNVSADIWSVTSFTELRHEGLAKKRYNLLHPKEEQQSYVEQLLENRQGPVIAATDYMRLFADQIRPFVKASYVTLGTDGYGRSDTRAKLRHFFEVNDKFIVITALNALADDGAIGKDIVMDALQRYKINPDKIDPATH